MNRLGGNMSQHNDRKYPEPQLIDLGPIEKGTQGGIVGDPEPMNTGLEDKAAV
jgi:hypothetical protein